MDTTLDAKTLTPSFTDARKWADNVVAGDRLPFSFQYGGRAAADLIPGWEKVSRTSKTKAGVTTRELTWRDPATGLECVLEMQTFANFPAVEWVMRLRNAGTEDTPLLSDLRGLDLALTPPANEGKPTIHAVRGCRNGDQPASSFHPLLKHPTPSFSQSSTGGTGKYLELGIIPGIFPPCWRLKQGRARKGISYQCEAKIDNGC